MPFAFSQHVLIRPVLLVLLMLLRQSMKTFPKSNLSFNSHFSFCYVSFLEQFFAIPAAHVPGLKGTKRAAGDGIGAGTDCHRSHSLSESAFAVGLLLMHFLVGSYFARCLVQPAR